MIKISEGLDKSLFYKYLVVVLFFASILCLLNFACSNFNRIPIHDITVIKNLRAEFNSNLNKLTYDQSLLKYGKPKHSLDGDSIFFATWDIVLSGIYCGKANIGFDRLERKMVNWKFDFENKILQFVINQLDEIENDKGKLDFDKSMVRFGIPNERIEGDNLFIAGWEISIDNYFDVKLNLAFDKKSGKMIDWKYVIGNKEIIKEFELEKY